MKNLLLFSTLLITTAGAFAQLSVKPNGTTDSYVYVKDQVLYVANEINLTRNTNGPSTTEASIYLRDNGQLIQGGTTSSNSGNGQLSVQQNTPVTNAWAYYYWCSPIGNPGTLATANPPGNRSFGVNFLYEPTGSSLTAASNVQTTTNRDGLKTIPITISTRWLYTHVNPGTEAEGNYQRMNSGNNAPPGFGFTMKGVGPLLPALDQTYEFRGRPNNGEFLIPVQAPAQPGPPGTLSLTNARMTLSGNPYPSALDLNRVFFDSENGALSAFYFYDENRTVASHYYSDKPFGYGVFLPLESNPDGDPLNPGPTAFNPGVYTDAPFYIWNSNGGTTGSSGSGSEALSHRFAPIGQGIMFVGNTPTVTNVKVKNSHRRFIKEGLGNHSLFHRPGSDVNNDTDNQNITNSNPTLSTSSETVQDYRMPQTRLYVIFDEEVTRDMLLVFSNQATDGYDRGMDGLSPTGLTTDAYFPVGNDNNRLPYVINSVNYEGNKQIPISFVANNATQIRLQVVEEVKKPYEHAYLFDSQENTYKELTNSTLAGVTLSLPAGTYDNRFFIVFRNPNLKRDIPENEIEAKDVVLANVNFFQNNPVQQLEVSNPEGYTIKSAMVYDMNGKLVIQEKNLGAKNKYSFYTGNLSDGVYLVKLTTTEDVSIDSKVIVHNK
jgi:hypothetical protein